jgi:LemA protein
VGGIIALIVVVVLVLIVIGLYNTLVRLRRRCDNGWAQIDVQLKRRYDLIPNLVETAKGYLKHEREVLENVTKARGSRTRRRRKTYSRVRCVPSSP